MKKLTTFVSLAVGLSVSHALQNDIINNSAANGGGQKELMHEAANFCKIDKSLPVGSTCEKTFHDINDINAKIRPDLDKLVKTDIFRFFKLDLYGQCPFWKDNGGYCVNRACAVDVVEDWDSVPAMWQPEALGGLEGGEVHQNEESDEECKFLGELCGGTSLKFSREVPDVDYCDVSDFTKKTSVLVDLTANPERFTGYGGEESAQIWSAIYKENCFTPGDKGLSLAKDVFYRLISGLHASIGTHLSNDFLNTTTGKWGPNLDLFMARVGNFPDRIANIYFDFAIVAKALWKIKPYLKHIEFCNSQDADVKAMIDHMVSQLDNNIFNEDLLFRDDLSSTMKNDFRVRFKNVTKIMDCVHCDRCRMWGKVQTTGYATSLKILFEIDLQNEEVRQHIVDHLTKYELIALFNTFDRISKSVEAITNFEKLYYQKINEGQGRLTSFFKDNNFFKLLCKARSSFTASAPATAGDLPTDENDSGDVGSTEREVKFTDLVMPSKPQRRRSAPVKGRNNLQDAWHTEVANVRNALHNIWLSYVTFPRTIYRITLIYLNRWFNKFIGVEHYARDDDGFLFE